MSDVVHGIKVDYSRDELFDELGKIRLKESYMKDDEESPQERFAYVSSKFGSDPEHAQRLYEYSSKHWLSYSTPILSFGRSKRGLPISCFLNYIEDTAQGLVQNLSETNWLSMMGGGVGIGFGIRSADDKSTGVMPHLKMYDASSLAYRQGRTRRGSYAAYLDISHPDILIFLEMRKPTGDQNQRCLNLHHGINITNDFMELIEKCMKDGDASDTWNLIDPHTKEIVKKVSARDLWQKILENRVATGEPYICYIDHINDGLPEQQKKLGLSVKHSNLCTEITLPTDEDRTAVCCLSSVNLEKYDEWKDDKLFISDLVRFLDNVLQSFIDNAPDSVFKAKNSAIQERSIGLGAMGFHAYLQKNNIAFESAIAKAKNKIIFKHIKDEAVKESKRLAIKRGEAPDMEGTGMRNAHLLAIAPNASSSIICGTTSPSIEPYRANAYVQKTMSGSFLVKNKYLEKLLEQKGINNEKTWTSILANRGSVLHLKDLSDYEKDVFKTSIEINQQWIIERAADRQEYICQGQSLNVFVPADVNVKELHDIHMLAWKRKLKTLYYCRSEAIKRAELVSLKVERTIIPEADCLACEG